MAVGSGAPVASLAMYPYPPLRWAYDALWRGVAGRLDDRPDELDWTMLTPDVWRHPDLLVAQTCGWPLITELADRLVVIGSFDHDVPDASDGYYSSVIVSRHDVSFAALRERPGVIAAVNDVASLSGRVSLEHAWGGMPAVLETGAHMESARALADGRADVASIDAVSWALIGDLEPALLVGLRVVARGPRVPTLPIVVGLAHSGRIGELRSALSAAIADPDLRAALKALRIRGFVDRTMADYLGLRTLLP